MDCIHCKGKLQCGKTVCAFTAQAKARSKVNIISKKEFSGIIPAPFIGRMGYPNLSVGFLSTSEKKEDYDNPRKWATENYSMEQILDIRTSLLNARTKAGIMEKNRTIETLQLVAMAKTAAEGEIKLTKTPGFSLNTDPFTAPTGPKGMLKKAEITSNPTVEKVIEKVVSDTDLKATDAIKELFGKLKDETKITNLLSTGVLGQGSLRKLVPTRWAITAVDDTLGKELQKNIPDFNEISHTSHFGSYQGNYYLILTFPGPWSYELFEIYIPRSSYNKTDEIKYVTDYEGPKGRTNYAHNTGGGYYASKLPLLEHLNKIKKRGQALVIRFITKEYTIPLGVWVCREATRKSLNEKPIEFSDRNLMLTYTKNLAKKKFGIDLTRQIKESIIIKQITTQKRIFDF